MAASNLSIADLERELRQRQAALQGLQNKEQALRGQLAEVQSEIASILGGGAGRKRGLGRPPNMSGPTPGGPVARQSRTKNAMTLADSIANAMEVGAVSSPKEVAAFVMSNGYRTTSKTFGIQVATTLTKDERFKRVGRGQYKRIK
jgi:hypothetical protein